MIDSNGSLDSGQISQLGHLDFFVSLAFSNTLPMDTTDHRTALKDESSPLLLGLFSYMLSKVPLGASLGGHLDSDG